MTSDPHRHFSDCDFRLNPSFTCTCPEGAWADKHTGSRHHIDEELGGAHAIVSELPIEKSARYCHQCNEFFKGPHRHFDPFVSPNESPAEPKLREYTSEERKTMPVHKGVMGYFPDALASVARVSFKGNQKHNPGEPLHWARHKSSDHGDCAARHLMTPNAVDPDSGEIELAHAAWRILAELQLAEEKRLVAAGIRPLSGIVT